MELGAGRMLAGADPAWSWVPEDARRVDACGADPGLSSALGGCSQGGCLRAGISTEGGGRIRHWEIRGAGEGQGRTGVTCPPRQGKVEAWGGGSGCKGTAWDHTGGLPGAQSS